MADIEAVLGGVIAALKTVDGLRVCDDWPEEITPPSAAVQIEGIDYDTTMSRGSDDIQLVVHLWTSKTSNRAGLTKLWSYLKGSGDSSVKQAIEADHTLGGVAQFVEVRQVRTPGFAVFGEMQYYSAQVVVIVGVDGL